MRRRVRKGLCLGQRIGREAAKPPSDDDANLMTAAPDAVAPGPPARSLPLFRHVLPNPSAAAVGLPGPATAATVMIRHVARQRPPARQG